ncbi:MAG TPA: hypothetical protein VKH37_13125 [Ferruginibacter sp.]|nr:hypothetical protein [Ferruginibacter sp.]
MKQKLFIAIILFTSMCHKAVASADDSLIIGTWKGTSICQVKDSPCHDEIAAYHIAKGDRPGTYRVVGNKIVNGVEEEMGVLDFDFDATTNTLTYANRAHNSIWKFKVTHRTMEGTLVVKGQLYRIIKLKKEG